MLRCKFRLIEVNKTEYGRALKLSASCEKDGDNQDWSKYTPTGELSFTVTNEAAFEKIDALKPGDHFYIDINAIEPEAVDSV